MNDEDKEFITQHQVASRLAARAEIQDIRLLRTATELHREPALDRKLTYDLDFDSSVDWNEDNTEWFVVRIACSLRIELSQNDDPSDDPDDAEDEAEDPVATSDFEYAALFNCSMRDGDAPLAEEELLAYGATTARFLLYPFIREYIHDTTSRLALPPLTIGVLSRPMP